MRTVYRKTKAYFVAGMILALVLLVFGCKGKKEAQDGSLRKDSFSSISSENLNAFAESFGIKLDTPFAMPGNMSELNRSAYSKIAGIYIHEGSRLSSDDIRLFRNVECSWGSDYSLGRYSAIIDYSDGSWAIGENGESIPFSIINNEGNTITIDRGESTTPRESTIVLNPEFVMIQNEKYIKLSGPDNPMKFLKDLLQIKKNELSALSKNLIASDDAKKMIKGNISQIVETIASGNIEKIRGLISTIKGIRFGLDEKQHYLGSNDAELNELLQQQSASLKAVKNSIGKAQVYVNEFKYLNGLKAMQLSEEAIAVEYLLSRYDYFVFIVDKENGKWKLIAIINNLDLE
jgi:hypothetical protein